MDQDVQVEPSIVRSGLHKHDGITKAPNPNYDEQGDERAERLGMFA